MYSSEESQAGGYAQPPEYVTPQVAHQTIAQRRAYTPYAVNVAVNAAEIVNLQETCDELRDKLARAEHHIGHLIRELNALRAANSLVSFFIVYVASSDWLIRIPKLGWN